MFAGPNGSGKSELKQYLPSALLGIYLNADEVEEKLRRDGLWDLGRYQLPLESEEISSFFRTSSFLASAGLADLAAQITFADNCLRVPKEQVNSYLASVAIDFLRQKLLEHRISFTLETVMSHTGKVDLLAQAQQLGYRTYLYFIATDDPDINISRVRNRVSRGGHGVPPDKIRERYFRSLDLLMDALKHTDRGYIFDNSQEGVDHTWLAEVTGGRELEIKTDEIPVWFKQAVLDKIPTENGTVR